MKEGQGRWKRKRVGILGSNFVFFYVIHYHYSKSSFSCHSSSSQYLMQGFTLISFYFHLFILEIDTSHC